MKKYFSWFSILLLTLVYSCKKTDIDPVPARNPIVTNPGVPDGQAISKTITPAGGSVASTDGRIRIEFPAGAIAADQVITVQPVTNTLEAGYGKAYRITPHNIQFNKPVKVIFSYEGIDISNTLPELLGIAYQDSTGAWRAGGAAILDQVGKTVSVPTTHFSDWGFFPTLYIQPADARIEPNATLDLAVMGMVEPDALLVPLPGGAPLTDPYLVPEEYVGQWTCSGQGKLSSKGSKAVYTAPSKLPAANPEAVSVQIKMKRAGAFYLVSNITILSDFHIDYMQVDETDVQSPQQDYPSRLFIYGSFGNDPGADKRSVRIGNINLNVMFWTPGLIVCELYSNGAASSGKVDVSAGPLTDSKILNEWLVDLEYAKVETPGGALTRRVTMVVRIRADANGFFKEGQQPLFEYTDLNDRSKGVITMPGGSFTSNVTMEACGAFTVKWDPLNEVEVERTKYSQSHKGFAGRIVYTSEGIKLKISLLSDDILRTTRSFAPCVGDGYSQVVMEPISVEGFHEKEIFLRFSGSGTGASILAGEMPTIGSTGVAPGLFFDVTDLNPEALFTTLKWKEAPAKYQ